jgi:hypothetical protein
MRDSQSGLCNPNVIYAYKMGSDDLDSRDWTYMHAFILAWRA